MAVPRYRLQVLDETGQTDPVQSAILSTPPHYSVATFVAASSTNDCTLRVFRERVGANGGQTNVWDVIITATIEAATSGDASPQAAETHVAPYALGNRYYATMTPAGAGTDFFVDVEFQHR